MSSPVSLISVLNVRPASPTPQPRWRRLSNLDFMLDGFYYSKFVYYYPPPSAISFEVLVSKLKESLALTLVHFYVFAGRVQTGSDGRPQVNCNDAGIPLRVAWTNARFDDWNDIDECTIEDHLNTPVDFFPDIAAVPIFQFQVTQFACGSIALGGAGCEIVVDGYSATEFMHAWSRLHRGLPIAPPLFNTDLLKAREPPVVSVPVPDYVAGTDLPPACKEVASASSYRRTFLTISPANLQAVVREVEEGPFGYGRATSFEAVAGLFWKSMTEARNLSDDDTTGYSYPLSWRGNNKWRSPPIPYN